MALPVSVSVYVFFVFAFFFYIFVSARTGRGVYVIVSKYLEQGDMSWIVKLDGKTHSRIRYEISKK